MSDAQTERPFPTARPVAVPLKWCLGCRKPRPQQDFAAMKGGRLGLNSKCRTCTVEIQRQAARARGIKQKVFSRVEGDLKLCVRCHEMKALDGFAVSPRGLCGRSAYCRSCASARYHDDIKNREARRINTARWRKENRPRALALHRLHQWKRRNQIDAATDGTVTDAVLEQVYETEACAYCRHSIPQILRTLDHIIALAKGGLHSASNVTMACLSCNSSKADRDLSVFVAELEKKGLIYHDN